MSESKKNTDAGTEDKAIELGTDAAPEGPAVGAQPGKVQGTATVTPKGDDVQGSPARDEEVAPKTKPGVGENALEQAFRNGYTASQRGTPNRPPLGYTDAEVKEWYRGYKTHANPNSRGTVDGIEQGYRKDY